jgi:hypothetical protein
MFLWDAADFIGIAPFDLEDTVRNHNDEVAYAIVMEVKV